MNELLTRLIYLAVPILVAVFLEILSSRVWVRLGRVGGLGIYLILVGALAHFEDGGGHPWALLYSAMTLAGMVLLVGDAGGRFARRERENQRVIADE